MILRTVAILTLLLLTCCFYSGGDWFFVTIIPILFGLSVLFAPFVVGQIPTKGFWANNKGLLVMLLDTVLLYATVIGSGLYGYGSDFWRPALLNTTVSLLFPWGLFLMIRYIKANAFVRAGLCTIFGGLFFTMIENLIYWITEGVFRVQFRNANLLVWNDYTLINANVYLLILITGCVIGGVLLMVGLLRKKG